MQLRSVARARERGPFARPSAEVAKICILPFEVATRVTLARLDMDSTHGHVFKGIHIYYDSNFYKHTLIA